MMQSPDKAIRRATMVAKGLAKEIGPLPTSDHPKPPHPASMIPGVHVTGMGDGPQTFADGGDVEPTDETGFDAYHGSPHEFPAERLIQHPTGEQKHILASQPVPEGAQVVKDYPLGRFRSDRIGTGAGEQAYGHGLYFAQAEPTAESYISNADWKYRGKRAENIYNDLYNNARERNLNGQGWDDLNAQRSFWERVVVGKAPRAIIEESKVYPEDYGENEKKYISTLNPKGFKRTGGHMYRVRVNANPEHFLDWNKPLREQHPHVQQALSFLGLNPQDEGHPSRPGEAAYRAAVFQHGKDPAKAAAALQAAGIPGIRYLDANSRDPNTGNPTHNHVVFDPSKITIKRRYARGGVVKKFSVGGDVSSYQGEHKAPSKDDGAPLHDVTNVYPSDVYSPNGFRYYGDQGNDYDRQAFNIMSEAKGRPYSKHTVYRAVPKEKNIKDINPGDWVAIHPQYAKDHGESALNGNYKILKKTVNARDLYTSGDSHHEWGYDPQQVPNYDARVAETNESRAKFGMQPVEKKPFNAPGQSGEHFADGDDIVSRALQLTQQHAPVPAAVTLARNLMPGRR